MVLVIKTTKVDINHIAKNMINIMIGLTIFNIDGVYINSSQKFNTYSDNYIEYDINSNIGLLILYENIKNIKFLLLHKIKYLIDTYNIQCYKFDNGNKLYTNFLFKKKIKYDIVQFNRDLVQESYDFIWYISNDSQNTNIYNTKHKFLSLTTLIYDNADLFNVKNNHYQINYPLVTQYNIYKNNRLCTNTIYISKNTGLLYNIYNIYNYKLNYQNSIHIEKYKFIEWKIVYNKHIENISINNNYYYKDIDKCVLTNIPLYDKISIIELYYNNNIIYLPINLCVLYNIQIIDNKVYFNNIHVFNQYKFINIYTSIYKHSFSNILKKLNIEPLYKEILCSIYKNNFIEINDYIYIIDIYKKKIYEGNKTIVDQYILSLKDSSSIIFKYKII